jgi:hydroxyquinol 1,2-dioxygenase
MRNLNEANLTETVVAQIDRAAEARFTEVATSLIRHLHAFVRETELTEKEWLAGIEFLTATGHKCAGNRQEFILLSDTLGLSMLTIALNHAKPPDCTEATVVGPFHTDDAPHVAQGADIARDAPGKPLDVDVTLHSTDGTPVANAEVDVWQADDAGKYDVQYAGLAQRRARAVLRSDAQGRVRFSTIVPTAYPVPTDGPVGQMLVATGRHPWRPAHLHFMIKAPGHEMLVTHLFREGDPYLDSDVVFGVRNSLIVQMPENLAKPGRHVLRHDFVLNPTH